jgi:acyl carrier protein
MEDLKSKLLVVVAEKTGYPLEILDLNMDMEADLGIDSIKRVEILSAFRESTPNMPELKGKEMAGLRTLAEVVSFVESSSGSRGLL